MERRYCINVQEMIWPAIIGEIKFIGFGFGHHPIGQLSDYPVTGGGGI
jgi:hypothetical protein